MDKNEFEKEGLHCLQCDSIIYSAHVRDLRSCKCGNATVDGGDDYFRCLFKDPAQLRRVFYDKRTGAEREEEF
jgi:hypothetical protein